MLKSLETIRRLDSRTGGSSGNPLLASHRSGATGQADKMECGLCYEAFQPTDEVFSCKKMHVFHTRCYEESVA